MHRQNTCAAHTRTHTHTLLTVHVGHVNGANAKSLHGIHRPLLIASRQKKHAATCDHGSHRCPCASKDIITEMAQPAVKLTQRVAPGPQPQARLQRSPRMARTSSADMPSAVAAESVSLRSARALSNQLLSRDSTTASTSARDMRSGPATEATMSCTSRAAAYLAAGCTDSICAA